jgi:hypothetical protein
MLLCAYSLSLRSPYLRPFNEYQDKNYSEPEEETEYVNDFIINQKKYSGAQDKQPCHTEKNQLESRFLSANQSFNISRQLSEVQYTEDPPRQYSQRDFAGLYEECRQSRDRQDNKNTLFNYPF